MVEVEKLCKKNLFIINLGRIKQITRDKCFPKGEAGLQPPQTLPWIRLCPSHLHCTVLLMLKKLSNKRKFKFNCRERIRQSIFNIVFS